MKYTILLLMSILCFNSCTKAQQTNEPNGKVLVAYFSCTGTTERVAGTIAKATNGELYRITPEKEYTSADLNWTDKRSRSSMEMADEKSRPAIKGERLNINDYDVIFIGFPIWWDLCPRAVNTFIEKYDLSGKNVVVFATSGGSSITNSARELKKLYPKIKWKDARLLNGNTKQTEEWINSIAY